MMMPRSFGKRGCLIGPRVVPRTCISFGKRLLDASALSENEVAESPAVNDFASNASKCLWAICCDLSDLYRDPASSHGEPICRMTNQAEAQLVIGRRAIISVDAMRGLYVLKVRHSWGSLIAETASVRIILDHLISHLVEDHRHYFSRSVDGVKERLLERTLHGVERIVIPTNHQHFNKTRTVEATHVSVCSISDSVENLREPIASRTPDGQILHLSSSPPNKVGSGKSTS